MHVTSRLLYYICTAGLCEPNLSTNAENKAADEIAFNDLCEMNLPVKPVLVPMGCERLGRLEHDRNRRLRSLVVQQSIEK